MKYITNYGDTFDIIAFKVYGNEELMGLIMNANPKHIETAVFDQGTEIEAVSYTHLDVYKRQSLPQTVVNITLKNVFKST